MKQTARELLLAPHAEVTPRLDAIRHAVLADATPITASQLLPALFRPNGRLWLSLAAVWVVILAVNFTQHQPSPPDDTAYVPSWSANQTQLHALLAQTGPDR